LWKEVDPFYSGKGYDHLADDSRGTESVLNALVLSSYDAQKGEFGNDTRIAFDNMWALQLTTGGDKGAWPWLQFGGPPWEAPGSQYYGATLAAIAVGLAPQNYRVSPDIENNLKLLRLYINREYDNQPLINRVLLLWAGARVPGLIEAARKQEIIDQILDRQEDDGGWSLPPLCWTVQSWKPVPVMKACLRPWIRSDGTWQEQKSDGYATALITFSLQQSGLPPANIQLKRAVDWLLRNQDGAEGFWSSLSPNVRRNRSTNIGRFMSDAATAFAVLALTENENRPKGSVTAGESAGQIMPILH
jgi:squalene-hopene/tetraprenyl-beta-curcumene cyclase